MANNGYAVEMRGICKQYPGGSKKANNNISLVLKAGEILCIAGENGAGKTTLMKILCGLETPDAGEIFVNGEKVIIDSPVTAKNLGIGMVHQHSLLFDEYTVAENITMGIEPIKWGFLFDTAASEKAAKEVIKSNNFNIRAQQKIKDLSAGEKQQVTICRILHRNADIIILDEPTSILGEQEVLSLFNTLKKLAAAGKSLILITHKLKEIKLICDRLAVLRNGELVCIREADKIEEYEIASLMIGGGVLQSLEYPRPRANETNTAFNSNPVIVFDNVTVLRRGQKQPLLDGVSFSLKSGEIIGFAAVGGNGLGVLEAVLGGFLHPASGKITHGGRDISNMNIRGLRKAGLTYVPADRLRVGSALEATTLENMMVNRRFLFKHGFFLDKKAIRTFVSKLTERYNITGISAAAKESAHSLSGGNLQKLILAREIDWLKDYIVFSEPTWGLDLASANYVHGQITGLRNNGAAVILISTNLDEILSLADRIMVMYRGRIAGEFVNSGTDSLKEKIGACMQGLFGD
ncbi:MAG: ABC transporter ATP-binding protein [Treponema sp.]|nr:ABC transporter ATP-binding protein [Treponema sp.]